MLTSQSSPIILTSLVMSRDYPPFLKEGTVEHGIWHDMDAAFGSSTKHFEGKLLTFLECITDSEVRQKALKDTVRVMINEYRIDFCMQSDHAISELSVKS